MPEKRKFLKNNESRMVSNIFIKIIDDSHTNNYLNLNSIKYFSLFAHSVRYFARKIISFLGCQKCPKVCLCY